jgi:hypothetical protein
MRKLHVEIKYTEELLGTASADPEIHSKFVASKAPDAPSMEEEVAAIGVEEATEKAMTVFPKDEEGKPFTWDYQWKGFFKDSCGLLRRATNAKSGKIKAYKKEIDGLVFVAPRKVPLVIPEGGSIGGCQRPLRASTAQGERIALAHSETVPAGTTQEFDVALLKDDLVGVVLEWFEYGEFHGTGQWRNSGKGRFTCRVTDEKGKVLLDNM